MSRDEDERPDAARTTYEGAAAARTTYEGAGRETTYEGAARATIHESSPATPAGARRLKLNLPSRLTDEFEYVADLSSGSQADVVLCRRRSNGEEVAVKLYRGALGRVDRDAMARLDGADRDHVIPILDLQTWEGETWEVQEYFPRGSLADLMAREPGPMSHARVREILEELATAVGHIHERDVVHRDLKPANVLVRHLDPCDLVLADFGLATQMHASRAARSVAGTYAYCSPEAAGGRLQKAADWWAVGVIVHEALTGRHLFQDGETGALYPDHEIRVALMDHTYDIGEMPDERWSLVVRGLLTRDTDHRWALAQVEEWLAGGSPEVVEPRTLPGQPRAVPTFQLDDHEFSTPSQLSAFLRGDFDRGEALLADLLSAERLRGWLTAHGLGDLTDPLLGQVPSPEVLAPRLVQLQMAMDPDQAPAFRGRLLDRTSLEEVCNAAIAGDSAAIAWIGELRTRQVLGAWAAAGGGRGYAAAANERLRSWWAAIGRARVGAIESGTSPVIARCEGPLLKAALSEPARTEMDARARTVLDQGEANLPPWAQHLRTAAMGDQPDLFGVRALANVVIPVEREAILAQARAEQERRRTAQEAREREEEERRAAEQRRADRARRRRRRNRDVGASLLVLVACAVFVFPQSIGNYLLTDTLFRPRDAAVFDASARDPDSYAVSDWYAGCTVLLLALAAFLARPRWKGRRGALVAAGLLAAAALGLALPLSVSAWNSAEAATVVRLRTTGPWLNDEGFCDTAKVAFKTEYSTALEPPTKETWTVALMKAGSPFTYACGTIRLYHGWTLVREIDLVDDGPLAMRISSVTKAKNPKNTEFVIDTTRGLPVKLRLGKDYEPWS